MDATPTKRLNSVLSRSDHSSRNAEDDFRSEWKSKVRERGHTEGASPPALMAPVGPWGFFRCARRAHVLTGESPESAR